MWHIKKRTHKYLTHIKPYECKTNGTQTQGMHKKQEENEPVRQIVNNIQAPSYKIAK